MCLAVHMMRVNLTTNYLFLANLTDSFQNTIAISPITTEVITISPAVRRALSRTKLLSLVVRKEQFLTISTFYALKIRMAKDVLVPPCGKELLHGNSKALDLHPIRSTIFGERPIEFLNRNNMLF